MDNIQIIKAIQIGEFLNEVLVFDRSSQKQLLVKTFPQSIPEDICRSIAEDLDALSSISHYHFNNVQLLDKVAFSQDFIDLYGVPISAEDYFEGEDFNHWASHLRESPNGILDILLYCKDLACILDEIHSIGVKHCFVNLESILISPDKGLRLTHVTNRIYERYLDPDYERFNSEREALISERNFFLQIIEYFLNDFLLDSEDHALYDTKLKVLSRKFESEEQSFSRYVGEILALLGHDFMHHKIKSVNSLHGFLIESQLEQKDLVLCSDSVASLVKDMKSTMKETLSGLEDFGVFAHLGDGEFSFTAKAQRKKTSSKAAEEGTKQGIQPVPDAMYSRLEGLATGSAEAQAKQRAYVKKSALPLEILLPKSGIHLRLIPAGEVQMGSPETEVGRGGNELLYRSKISQPFYMAKFPITQGQWNTVMSSTIEKSSIARFMKKTKLMNDILTATPSHFKDSGDDSPVENVTWFDTEKFLKKLCDLEDLERGSFTLPTEGQWEYSCRAGTTTRFYSGDSEEDLMRVGWYANNKSPAMRTQPVGKKLANAFGLYDMHGNVWEWCQDWYGVYSLDEAKKYKGEELLELNELEETGVTDYRGPKKGQHKMTKGGSWTINDNACRSADRSKGSPTNRSAFLGFRITMKLRIKNKI